MRRGAAAAGAIGARGAALTRTWRVAVGVVRMRMVVVRVVRVVRMMVVRDVRVVRVLSVEIRKAAFRQRRAPTARGLWATQRTRMGARMGVPL